MAFKPETSVGLGLAVGAVVYATYSNLTPSIADIRAADMDDDDVEATRKQAAWLSAGVVAGISLITKDPTIFVIGGGLTIALDWYHRHANMVNPMTGKASSFVPNFNGASDQGVSLVDVAS